MVFITNSPEETFLLGKKLGKYLKPQDVVALIGELSAGKTCFIKGIADSLNIKNPVTSPTFTIVNEYKGDFKLNHFDVYRIEKEDLYNIGFDEYIFSNSISLIEWADKILPCLPSNYIEVKIDILTDVKRKFEITGIGNYDTSFLKEVIL